MKLYPEFLKQHSNQPMELFVETGVGRGTGLAAASQVFERCLSVEIDKGYFEGAKSAFQSHKNVAIFWNSSPPWIAAFADVMAPKSTTFWLDAHYGGRGPAPEVECPLLDELAAIMAVPWARKPVILIDDAYYFGVGRFWSRGLSKAYTKSKWPTLEQVLAAAPGCKHEILWNKGRPKVIKLTWAG